MKSFSATMYLIFFCSSELGDSCWVLSPPDLQHLFCLRLLKTRLVVQFGNIDSFPEYAES